jgi:hypothetical protein
VAYLQVHINHSFCWDQLMHMCNYSHNQAAAYTCTVLLAAAPVQPSLLPDHLEQQQQQECTGTVSSAGKARVAGA